MLRGLRSCGSGSSKSGASPQPEDVRQGPGPSRLAVGVSPGVSVGAADDPVEGWCCRLSGAEPQAGPTMWRQRHATAGGGSPTQLQGCGGCICRL